MPQAETPPLVPRGQGRRVVIRNGGPEERIPSWRKAFQSHVSCLDIHRRMRSRTKGFGPRMQCSPAD